MGMEQKEAVPEIVAFCIGSSRIGARESSPTIARTIGSPNTRKGSEMTNFIVHSVSDVSVSLNSGDGYINATALAQAHKIRTGQRKDVSDWARLKKTSETLKHLSSVTGIPVTALTRVVQGGNPSDQGTWIHPRLAVRFAMWLSDDFGLMVEDWVRDWRSPKEEGLPYLPPHIEAVQVADSIRHITDTLDDHPRLAQILIDHSVNEIIEKKSLPASQEPQLRGVAEIAKEMGFKVDNSSRVKLGKFIVGQGFSPTKERRICNGIQTLINCYEDSSELRQSISEFFS